MKKVFIDTLGCQMNKSDTERMLGILSHFDYEETREEEDANLLIINTCSIRQLSEDKAFSQIGTWGRWKKKGKDIKIGFCGCVAQQKANEVFKRAPYVDFVLGTHNLYKLPEIIKRVESGEKVCECAETNIANVDEKDEFGIVRVKSTNAWIPITEGCNNFCTYCIVPYTRGRERSHSPEIIIAEAKRALADGFKEITLLGQNVDSYGKDFKDRNYRLSNLLRDLNALDGNFRIRFVTSYPTDITDELIDTVVELDKVCEYFHIPMQSGNSEVLKKMNRRYDRETYAKIVAHVRDRVPDVTITSDFIAGFPSETEEQFEDTLSAIDEFELDYSNVAAYSPREKTVAARWVDKYIPDDVKEERFQRLNNKVKENCLKSNKKYLNRTMEVLIESFYEHKGEMINTGKTRNNKTVHIACDKNMVGQFVNVKIASVKTWYLKGELV
ncbi:MAG: tRNA (N6-isopentenyl adenosine(37)-C2)-methylthiotransferase MiaB [Clostridiaceae bacterium]|jgi:tRNA-2-methylthio-N6-dimethylallyladenosine synthase|nr:tRNA (N6-isopentenyl adenosine(37)-C2)-methylthiotransferase MiaB [Clostridiaceae bacterium]